MRRAHAPVLAAAILLVPCLCAAQEASRAVAGGGISVPGWTGKVDANEARSGQTLNNAKLAKEGAGMHVTTGPAVAYWNPGNKASGDYTVKATFTEQKYMALNSHPHPYGVFIGGNDLGTPNTSLLYCAAYGNGTFIVRGFGPAPFQMAGEGFAGKADPAVHEAAGVGQPVTQQIALQVKGDRVSCLINGKAVWSAPKEDVVAAGKLKSTDGVYGLRFTHNVEATVVGFGAKK